MLEHLLVNPGEGSESEGDFMLEAILVDLFWDILSEVEGKPVACMIAVV
jgi:hypothetical protein